MRLCAIYIVWDDWDMFLHSYRNIIKLVDGVILIGSEFSNFGERSYLPGFWHSPSEPEYRDWETKGQNVTTDSKGPVNRVILTL